MKLFFLLAACLISTKASAQALDRFTGEYEIVQKDCSHSMPKSANDECNHPKATGLNIDIQPDSFRIGDFGVNRGFGVISRTTTDSDGFVHSINGFYKNLQGGSLQFRQISTDVKVPIIYYSDFSCTFTQLADGNVKLVWDRTFGATDHVERNRDIRTYILKKKN